MFIQRSYCIYILTSKRNGTLYACPRHRSGIGITNHLKRRVYQHKNNLVEDFTKKYKVHCLVYFELFGHVGMAINREKDLKRWKRTWKLRLIEENNPSWKDLYYELE